MLQPIPDLPPMSHKVASELPRGTVETRTLPGALNHHKVR